MLQKRSAVESLVEYTCKGLMCNLHVFSTQHITLDSILMKYMYF